MTTDIRDLFPEHRSIGELKIALLDEKAPTSDRIDAAIYLMRLDPLAAEECVIQLLGSLPEGSFDFLSELIDVLFSDWASRGGGDKAGALLRSLSGGLRGYGEAAWEKSLANK